MTANASSLYTQLNTSAPVIYDQDSFRATLEYHLTLFRQSNSTYATTIDPRLATVYNGDFYGLLYYLQIAPELHWLYLRVNYMTHPNQFSADRASIIVPSQTLLNRIIALATTVTRPL